MQSGATAAASLLRCLRSEAAVQSGGRAAVTYVSFVRRPQGE